MKYVLDASVALKWVLTEPDSAKALSVRDDFRKQVHELLAPDVFPVEVGRPTPRAAGMFAPPRRFVHRHDHRNEWGVFQSVDRVPDEATIGFSDRVVGRDPGGIRRRINDRFLERRSFAFGLRAHLP